jgi:hypothetical protein
VSLVNLAKYYSQYFLAKNFYDALHGLINNSNINVNKLSPEAKNVLHMLFRNYALYLIINDFESFYLNFPS